MRIFLAYRDAPERRHALDCPVGAPERYRLYGLDALVERGHAVSHNLVRRRPPAWARVSGGATKALLGQAGGYGGDFSTVLASLAAANRSDVVLSTVDTVGIPLMLARRVGVLRVPLVYTAIGLPERLAQLRSERMRRLYAGSLAGCASVVAYSEHEAEAIRAFLAAEGEKTHVEFVPFGVDQSGWAPSSRKPSVDVVTVGADPHRDLDLFARVAEDMSDVSFRLVTTADRTLPSLPGNVEIETDIPLGEVRRRLDEARVVALPVVDNSYSGATTVLLQAMALGKPIVVTRTKALSGGYGLVDGHNCRLVEPGDAAGFGSALSEVLRDDREAGSLGAQARAAVEPDLTWSSYVGRMERLLRSACGAAS